MPSLFGKKKTTPTSTPPQSPTEQATTSEKDKKSKGYFVREREKEKSRPKSPRASKSFGGRTKSNNHSFDEHPLNLPEDLRRLSALSAMSSPPQQNGDLLSGPMETTPAPEMPGAFVMPNGAGGDTSGSENEGDGPAPPLHRTPTSPAPEPELPPVDPEECKAAGNKLYKAGQYNKAIEEYTKGLSVHVCL